MPASIDSSAFGEALCARKDSVFLKWHAILTMLKNIVNVDHVRRTRQSACRGADDRGPI